MRLSCCETNLLRIVMLGSGKEKPRLVAEAEQRQLENLLFLPPVAKQDMAATLAGADACLAILKPIEMFKTTYPNKVSIIWQRVVRCFWRLMVRSQSG